MTTKELREIARVALAEELVNGKLSHDNRVLVAVQVLHSPADLDEEREAQRKHVGDMNAAAPVHLVDRSMSAGGQFMG